MTGLLRLTRVVGALLLVSPSACSRQAPSSSSSADASGSVPLALRVPAALTVTRALDALSVAVDPTSLGMSEVTAHAGTNIGIETSATVFRMGLAKDLTKVERREIRAGSTFEGSTISWNAQQDGIPVSGTKYVVEVQFTLFETDVAPGPTWNPHAGNFRALWSRTLRQAEE